MSDQRIVINQFLVKCNELIPDLDKSKHLNIVCGIITEAYDAYWHFIISRIEIYKDSQRTELVKTISSDEIEYYTKISPVIFQIYKKDKHLENIYIDKYKGKDYVIQVLNVQKEYHNSKYYTWRFEQK